MKRQLLVEEGLLLNISFDELQESTNHQNDEEYWLDVSVDDNYDYSVQPKGDDYERFMPFNLDEYDQIEKMTFEELLDHFNITGYEVAAKTKLSRSNIYQFISGDRNVRTASVETVRKISEVLGLNLGLFLDLIIEKQDK